jgi:hypothetical protein
MSGCRIGRSCGVVFDEGRRKARRTEDKETRCPSTCSSCTNPQGPSPRPKWAKFEEEIKGAEVYLDNNGLARTDSATTVRVRDGERQVTDGPFAETKEYLAGYFLIDVDDLDAALDWAARIPSAEYGSVEVRPMWGES